MTRLIAVILAVLAAWPFTAQAAPSAYEILDAAVKALDTTCYEARMRFLADPDTGEEQKVFIMHVAPELFRVKPLVRNTAGQWEESDETFYENGQEMVRYSDTFNIAEVMPVRQFKVNDSLTVKFLRDMGMSEEVTVLEGYVGTYEVYILRHDPCPARPYMITVGIDQRNSFPLLLLVNDAQGRRRISYEIEAIEYKHRTELPRELFTIPGREKVRTPEVRTQNKLPSAMKSASSSPARPVGAGFDNAENLPPYPTWLPPGFRLEGIVGLIYQSSNQTSDNVSIVYQYEIYGEKGRFLSLFLTQSDSLGLSIDSEINSYDGSTIIKLEDWIVAIIGNQGADEVQKIIDGLVPSPEEVSLILEQTLERDRIQQQALDLAKD